MKAIQKKGGKTSLVQLDTPMIQKEDEVLIRIQAGAICRTDVYVYQNKIESNDVILGHECAGIVVGKGSSVHHLSIGDRVSINPFVGCGQCSDCQKGNYQLCTKQLMLGKEVDGVFADYVVVPQSLVVPFQKETSPLKIAFFEPVLAMAALLNTSIKKGSKILIYGENRIATLTQRILEANGYGKVDCFIPNETLELYDVVVETVPNSEGLNRAVSLVKDGGTLILKSRIFNPLEINLFPILQRGVKIEPAYYYDNIPHTVEMIEKELYLDDLMGNLYDFDSFEEVFKDSLRKESLKNFLGGGN